MAGSRKWRIEKLIDLPAGEASLLTKNWFRPELAWTCCDYADAQLQRNEPGDREKATSLLDESLTARHAALDGAGAIPVETVGTAFSVVRARRLARERSLGGS